MTGIILGKRAGTFPLLQTTQYLFTRCGWCYFARTDFLLMDGNDDVIDGIDGVASEREKTNKKKESDSRSIPYQGNAYFITVSSHR